MERFLNTHRAFEALLNEHVDGRLDAAQVAKLTAHLEKCSRCTAELKDLRGLAGVVRAEPMVEPPRSFGLPLTMPRPAASAGLAERGNRLGVWGWATSGSLAVLRSMQLATVAAALALVALVGLDLTGAMAPDPSPGISTLSEPGSPELRMQDAAASPDGQIGIMGLPPDVSDESSDVSLASAPAGLAVSESSPVMRSGLEWARLALSGLTAVLALGVVGLTWQAYRNPI